MVAAEEDWGCPSCGAEPGSSCSGPRGGPRRDHLRRWLLAAVAHWHAQLARGLALEGRLLASAWLWTESAPRDPDGPKLSSPAPEEQPDSSPNWERLWRRLLPAVILAETSQRALQQSQSDLDLRAEAKAAKGVADEIRAAYELSCQAARVCGPGRGALAGWGE